MNPDVPGFPPGLVTYLAVSDDHLTSAFNRSLTSLAERGWLVITPEDNGASSARLVETAVRGQLPASEMLVLERVRTCSRSMPTVPLSELTNPDGDAYEKWRKRFKRALDEESRAAGLTTRRMPGALTVPFSLVTAAVTGAIGAVAASADRSGVAIGAGLAGFVAGLVASVFLTEHRPTELGKQAAAQARIEMRQASKERAALAQEPADAGTRSLAAPRDRAAAVTVPAPRSPAEALLEKDGRPLPEGKAWSAFTGRWRVVSVGPLEAPVQRGRPRALFTGIYYAAFGTLAASLYGLLAVKGLEGGALAAAPGALFVLYVLGRWLPAFTRRLSVVRRVVHRAQVVKRWMDHVSQPGSDTVSAEYYCSVDGGTTDETQSFRLAKNMYQRLNVGDIVEVDYSPRWRKLRRIRKLK